MNFDLLKHGPQRDPRKTMVGAWIKEVDKQRAKRCADALQISLSEFANRSLLLAIAQVETTLNLR